MSPAHRHLSIAESDATPCRRRQKANLASVCCPSINAIVVSGHAVPFTQPRRASLGSDAGRRALRELESEMVEASCHFGARELQDKSRVWRLAEQVPRRPEGVPAAPEESVTSLRLAPVPTMGPRQLGRRTRLGRREREGRRCKEPVKTVQVRVLGSAMHVRGRDIEDEDACH